MSRAGKKILLVTLIAFLTLFSVESAIATSKLDKPKIEKTTFTINCAIEVRSFYEKGQVTETRIFSVKDAISVGYIEADFGSSTSGTVWTSLSGTYDLNTMLGSLNGKWTFTTTGGTFEGSVVGFIDVAKVSGKFVGHGTNNLRGQKIMGSFEGTVNNHIVNLTLQGEIISKG